MAMSPQSVRAKIRLDGAGKTFAHRKGKDAAPGDTQAIELRTYFFFGGRYFFSIEATIT
jgi:hypothetical protein